MSQAGSDVWQTSESANEIELKLDCVAAVVKSNMFLKGYPLEAKTAPKN